MTTDLVDAVLAELRGRRGFRHLLESIEIEDPETWTELRAGLTAALTPAPVPPPAPEGLVQRLEARAAAAERAAGFWKTKVEQDQPSLAPASSAHEFYRDRAEEAADLRAALAALASSQPPEGWQAARAYALALMRGRLDVEAPMNAAAIRRHIAALEAALPPSGEKET
jgi:hypothetical protein